MKLQEQALNQSTTAHQAGAQSEHVDEGAMSHTNAVETTQRAYEKATAELAFPEETRTLPFIMPHPWETVMAEGSHDEPLRVHIVLLHDIVTILTDEYQSTIEAAVEHAIDGLPKSFGLPEALCMELSYAEPCVTMLPPSLAERLTVKQRRWLHNGIYVQAGFSVQDGDISFDLGRPIATAMTLFDSEVVGSNSVFVAQHEPKKIVGFAERDLVLEIGLVFDPLLGVADWNNSLVPLRNELLIKVGAALRGLEPEVEHDRFIKEGHEYFLDFTFGKV
jgi:hypothetical protein